MLPQLMELWGLNVKTDVEAKKLRRQSVNDNTLVFASLCAVRSFDGRLGVAVDWPC